MNDITIFNHPGNNIRVTTDNLGRTQKTNVVTEAGLYEVIILTERIDTAGKIRPQLLVTPAGQSYFANILSA